MPLLVIAGLFVPRLVLIYLYFFTAWFSGVFETQMWPILGFIFMPYTMLWYSAVMNWYGGEWDVLQIVVLVVAIISDVSSGKSGMSKNS
jgi:hypothetical protein